MFSAVIRFYVLAKYIILELPLESTDVIHHGLLLLHGSQSSLPNTYFLLWVMLLCNPVALSTCSTQMSYHFLQNVDATTHFMHALVC